MNSTCRQLPEAMVPVSTTAPSIPGSTESPPSVLSVVSDGDQNSGSLVLADEQAHRKTANRSARLILLGSILVAVASSTSCSDPVTDKRKTALGGEQAGVPQGPLHRPGQPCTVCHDGSDQRAFIVAGTVYASIAAAQPVQGARVTMTDANGDAYVSETNCAGNFFVRSESWKPRFPLTMLVSYGTQQIKMEGPVQREASCASCHTPETSNSSPGPVYLWSDTVPPGVAGGCQ